MSSRFKMWTISYLEPFEAWENERGASAEEAIERIKKTDWPMCVFPTDNHHWCAKKTGKNKYTVYLMIVRFATNMQREPHDPIIEKDIARSCVPEEVKRGTVCVVKHGDTVYMEILTVAAYNEFRAALDPYKDMEKYKYNPELAYKNKKQQRIYERYIEKATKNELKGLK